MNYYSIAYTQEAAPGLPPVVQAHLIAFPEIDGEMYYQFWMRAPAGKEHLPSHAVFAVKQSVVRRLDVWSTIEQALRAPR